MTTENFSTYVQAQTANGTLTSADLIYLLQLSLSPIPRKMTLGALADFVLTNGLANGDFKVGALGSIYADAGGFTTDGTGGAFFAGNVGIGTTSPTQKLDVGGSAVIGANDILRLSGAGAGSGVNLESLDTTESAYRPFTFYGTSYSFTNGGSPLVIYLANGNVGIGTVSPIYLLDAAGDINTSTLYRVGGTAGITTTVTTDSLVGKTITITGGIVTGFA